MLRRLRIVVSSAGTVALTRIVLVCRLIALPVALLLILLLIEKRVINRMLMLLTVCSILQLSLTVSLLSQAGVIDQNLLLLRKIAGLTFDIATNESSAAPWHLHEVLCEFLVSCLLFLSIGSRAG